MRTTTIRIISIAFSFAAAAVAYLLTHMRLFISASSTQTRSMSELAVLCADAPAAPGCGSIQMISLASTAVLGIALLLLFMNLVNLRRTPWRGFSKLPKSNEAAEETSTNNMVAEAAGLFAVLVGCAGFVYFLNQNKILAILLLMVGMVSYGILAWRK